MRICRGVSAVFLLAALASIALLALPATGQPATTTSPTLTPPTTTTGFGGSASTGLQQGGVTSNPFGTGATSTSTAPGASQSTAPTPGIGGEVGAPGRGAVLILVRRLTWRQAAATARGHSETITAGLISTLPGDASLAARVLSLAAGRQVDAAPLAGGADRAAIERMRAANPDAHFGGLPQVRVVAASGLESAALIGLGPTGEPPPPAPLEITGPPPPAAGELLVVAVPDAAGLQRVLEQLQPGSAAAGTVGGAPDVDAPPAPNRFVIVGLEPPKGRAHTAPFVALGGAPGVVTSESTRRRGLVAFQDLRPTLAGSTAGSDGATIRALAVVDPLAAVGRLDRQVAALVAARALAIPLAVVVGALALATSLVALLLRRRPAGARGGEALRRLARALLLTTLALPSGYLIASTVAPLSWPLWLGLGLGAAPVLALAAWLVSRFSGHPWPRRRASSKTARGASASATASATASAPASASGKVPAPAAGEGPAPAAGESSAPAAGAVTAVLPVVPAAEDTAAVAAAAKDGAGAGPADGGVTAGAGTWAAPALLGALLAALIIADLLLGGLALSRPLLGNSAFDGERFFGLGNGYFAHALAGLLLVVAFRQPAAATAAALLVGLALVDGLPILGADVGGALTAMLTAAAAWLLLRRRRWSRLRVLLVVGGALAIGAAIAFGVGLATGQVSHGSRIARELLGDDPSAALRAVRHQLSGNFGLLAGSFWAWWGPLLVIFAAVASLRPPSLLAGVPVQVRRAVGVGAIGSLLLIVLNDTGVTAAAGSGLALVVTLVWCALEPSPAALAAAGTKVAVAGETAAAAKSKPAEPAAPAGPVDDDDPWKPAVTPASGQPGEVAALGKPAGAPDSKSPAPTDRGGPAPAGRPGPASGGTSAEAGKDGRARQDPNGRHNGGQDAGARQERGARRDGPGR
jgi:hypothetical protein